MTTDYDKARVLYYFLPEVIDKHPFPWRVEHDWTNEVVAEDRTIIAKCQSQYDAENIIRVAEDMKAELDANAEKDKRLLEQLDLPPQPRQGISRQFVGISHHNHFEGRLDVATVESVDKLTADMALSRWVRQKKVKLRCDSLCSQEFAESLAELRSKLTGTIYGDIVDAVKDMTKFEITKGGQ